MSKLNVEDAAAVLELERLRRRADKLNVMWDFMERLGKLSTCHRAQCSAIVVPGDFSAVLAIGYNGPPRGSSNDACRDMEGNCGCVHAEASTLAKLDSLRVRKAMMLTSTFPCEHCAGLIANSNAISVVIYGRLYRKTEGQDVLDRAGILSYRIDEISYEVAHDKFQKLWATLRACQ